MSFAFVFDDGSFPFLLQGLIPTKHFAPPNTVSAPAPGTLDW